MTSRRRAAGAAVGVVFGFVLCWSGMSSPDVIRSALIFEDSYLYLMFASALLTATLGLRLLQRRPRRALLVSTPLGWSTERPERRHLVGAAVFGLGWGIADSCPGPIATQVGQGVPWALFTLGGVVVGVWVFLRRTALDTEPAAQPAAEAAPAGAASSAASA